MRTIAYKIVTAGSLLAKSLPQGWITEWTYVDLQPPGTVDDWLQLPEDQFQTLLASTNTDQTLADFQAAQNPVGVITQ